MIKHYKIWKLQRPLFDSTGGDFPQVMAYTENKHDMSMIPMGQEIIDEVFGDLPKIYVKASVKNGVLVIKNRVPDQEW